MQKSRLSSLYQGCTGLQKYIGLVFTLHHHEAVLAFPHKFSVQPCLAIPSFIQIRQKNLGAQTPSKSYKKKALKSHCIIPVANREFTTTNWPT